MKYSYEELEDGTIAVDIGKLIVDEEDVELASNVYLSISIANNNRRPSLGRFLLNPQKGLVVDHINNNTLDNRKCNLRICTHKENVHNRRKNRSVKHNFVKRDDGAWEWDCGKLLIDKENLELINKIYIRVQKSLTRLSIPLSRVIINAIKDKVVDHKNRNPMDNRKQNLRLCTHKENSRNISVRKQCRSGLKGVNWNKTNKKYVAEIRYNDKIYRLGQFDDKYYAGRVYDTFAKYISGEFAWLNFPNESLLEIDCKKHIKEKDERTFTSKYKGISYDKSAKGSKKWRAECEINGIKKRLGRFKTEEEAYQVYLSYIQSIKKDGEKSPS